MPDTKPDTKPVTSVQLLAATIILLIAIFAYWTLTAINEFRTQSAIQRIEQQKCGEVPKR